MRKDSVLRLREAGFVAVTVLLVFICVGLFAQTASCMSDKDIAEMEQFYQAKERVLVDETREFLEDEGYVNSGIMLTRVVDADGNRQYKIVVHHGDINSMCEEERAELLEELGKIVFVDENCSFFHEFLINQ